MQRRWLSLAVLCGAVYPLLVYFGMHILPPFVFIVLALVLLGGRVWVMGKTKPSPFWTVLFGVVLVAVASLWLAHQDLAVKAYPIIMSLMVAAVFTASLIFPPSAVERIARISEPDLPPEGVIYTRRVTMIWVVFLVMNAGISLATALWGTLAQWTLWNGLLSYIGMGILFAIEFLVRKRVRR